MPLSDVAVVGAAGLGGTATATELASLGTEPLRVVREPQDQGEVSFDTLLRSIRSVRSVAWCAGLSDHSLPDRDFSQARRRELTSLQELLNSFRGGDLCLLSSAAVYSGRAGAVKEDDCREPPVMPYGRIKYESEQLATQALESGQLASLTIFRLMYMFGTGEPHRRLIKRLARARRSEEKVTVAGSGLSYLNPLPVGVVGQIIARRLLQGTAGVGIFNLNSTEPFRVIDLVELLDAKGQVEVKAEGEKWPVHFWGDNTRLLGLLPELGQSMPDVRAELKAYYESLLVD